MLAAEALRTLGGADRDRAEQQGVADSSLRLRSTRSAGSRPARRRDGGESQTRRRQAAFAQRSQVLRQRPSAEGAVEQRFAGEKIAGSFLADGRLRRAAAARRKTGS